MQPPLAIYGSYMSGYGLPGLLAFVTVFAGLAGIIDRVWLRTSAVIGWLILYAFFVGTAFFVEAVSRRNVLEVRNGQIRWSIRQPPDKGDQPFSNLRMVEVDPVQVRLVFEKGPVVVNRVLFRRGDLERIVDGLHQLGAQVN